MPRPKHITSSPVNQPKTRRTLPRSTKKGPERSQADYIWKEVLEDFLERFMLLLFADYHVDIDWEKGFVSMDKEMVEISEQAGFAHQSADKLFKVFLKDGTEQLLLLHIEVQGYVDPDFAKRVYDYNDLIGRKYKLDVESFAILSDPDPNFRPNHYLRQRKHKRLLFEFEMVKLLDWWQRWDELEQSDNPFAIIIMAHLKMQRLKKRPLELKEAKFGVTRSLFEHGFNRQYVLKLLGVIEWLMKLPADLQAEYVSQVRKEYFKEDKKMPLKSFIEIEFTEMGRQEGEQKGMLTLIMTLLEQRFGTIEPELQQRLAKLNTTQLQELGRRLLSLSSLNDLTNWLSQIGG